MTRVKNINRLAGEGERGSSYDEAIEMLSSAVRDADELEVDELLMGKAVRILYKRQVCYENNSA